MSKDKYIYEMWTKRADGTYDIDHDWKPQKPGEWYLMCPTCEIKLRWSEDESAFICKHCGHKLRGG